MSSSPSTQHPNKPRIQPIKVEEVIGEDFYDVPDWLVDIINAEVKGGFRAASISAMVFESSIKDHIVARYRPSNGDWTGADAKVQHSKLFFVAGKHQNSLIALYKSAGWHVIANGHLLFRPSAGN